MQLHIHVHTHIHTRHSRMIFVHRNAHTHAYIYTYRYTYSSKPQKSQLCEYFQAYTHPTGVRAFAPGQAVMVACAIQILQQLSGINLLVCSIVYIVAPCCSWLASCRLCTRDSMEAYADAHPCVLAVFREIFH